MDIMLLRHGESEGNAQGRMQGRRDFPLSALGREQAARAAAFVAQHAPFAAVYASPLKRAFETASIVAAHGVRPEPVVDDDLPEIAAGAVREIGARGLDLQIALYGDAGSLELDWTLAGSDLRALRRGESEWRVRDIPVELSGVGEHPPPLDHPALGPFVNLSAGPRLFVDSIIEDRLATPNFYDGWKSQQVIDAAIASYEQGRWINIA